jgi:hypothetical protein
MARHVQTAIKGSDFTVDAKIATAVQRLFDAGLRTVYSCECDGNHKKFPAYINPIGRGEGTDDLRVASPREMAEAVGLGKGQWRSYNSVLWFNPKDVPNNKEDEMTAISNDDIRVLRDEAVEAGDMDMAALCTAALEGDADSRKRCALKGEKMPDNNEQQHHIAFTWDVGAGRMVTLEVVTQGEDTEEFWSLYYDVEQVDRDPAVVTHHISRETGAALVAGKEPQEAPSTWCVDGEGALGSAAAN